MKRSRSGVLLFSAALLSIWFAGNFGRGFWTPDEPREADLAWRMSWQSEKAVPLLAGEAFCEKPPLTYWMSGAAIGWFGAGAWAARMPNLLYALITALSVGFLARRSVDPIAGFIAAGAISTFLLSYQVAIWLATDAPLLAAVAAALLGAYGGFYARSSSERLRGYLFMHTALALGFMSKSAAAWIVPALTLATLIVWERRWQELVRWELYVGLLVQASIIGIWIWYVYVGADGREHLKIFFWNNLVGRFTHVEAPDEIQYAAGHRNTAGKYVRELPIYLWPWTLLIAAAARRAWTMRAAPFDERRPVRFALASALPALALLSLAATARNVYFASALPGFALLLGWWGRAMLASRDRWDVYALRGTAVLLVLMVAAFAAAVVLLGVDGWESMANRVGYAMFSGLGLAVAAFLSVRAILDTRAGASAAQMLRAQLALLLAYCALLAGPAYAIYGEVDRWQDLAKIGRAIGADARGRPLILFAPDETTRAFIDLYARTSVERVAGRTPAAAIAQLNARLAAEPRACVVVQMPGRRLTPVLASIAAKWAPRAESPSDLREPSFAADAHLRVAHLYELPNGRRYALLEASSER